MTAHVASPRADPGAYADNYAHLADELRAVNQLLAIRAATVRDEWQGRPSSSAQHLYISHDEVDWLLSAEPSRAPFGYHAATRSTFQTLRGQIEAKVAESRKRGVPLALPQLASLFGLSPFEIQVVVVCLAPELRRGYDRIYAYLQDDITRQRPTVDLALDLLCGSEAEKWAARAALDPQAPLLRFEILQTIDDPHSPSGSSGLARFLRIDPRILEFILGHRSLDARLGGMVWLESASRTPDELTPEQATAAALIAFARRHFRAAMASSRRVLVHLHGPRGAGKRDLALAVCHAMGRSMLCFDAQRLPSGESEAASTLRLMLRESLLLEVPLYIATADLLLRDDDRAATLRQILARAVDECGWFVFLAGERPWPYPALFEGVLFYSASLAIPDVPGREASWTEALRGTQLETQARDVAPRLAARFRLTAGRIRDAVRSVAHCGKIHGSEAISFETLAAACRAQAEHALGALATKIDPRAAWGDLVLPDDKVAQLRDICSQARHYYDVYERWGFGRKLARGRGLSALFCGPPGTGKTMAAEIIAAELQLDLYKIDLARVVSKYIGETEKNLSRIFTEAENSSAILFFDEADALFGKRTQISDAHDRYANVETSYLLQRMEDYDGIVVLASNLRENMDDAFLRRIRFIIDFPFPDAASRLMIWRAHVPAEAPVDAGVDYARLAEEIKVAGGSIKNIVLNAAFFAAADGGVINTAHLLRSARREFEKIGKLWDQPWP